MLYQHEQFSPGTGLRPHNREGEMVGMIMITPFSALYLYSFAIQYTHTIQGRRSLAAPIH